MENQIPESILSNMSQFCNDGFWLIYPSNEGTMEIIKYSNSSAPHYLHLAIEFWVRSYLAGRKDLISNSIEE